MIFQLDAEMLHGVLNVIINRFYYVCIQKRCLFIQAIGVVFDPKACKAQLFFNTFMENEQDNSMSLSFLF